MEKIILLLFSLAILFVICFIEIFVWINYGDLPINEIPSWALWFMFGGRK